MEKIKFTPSQFSVLEKNNCDILVSASAGSGKTATIIEKIFRTVESNKADLQELLVITFTEAASNEMKLRLKEKFYEISAQNPRIKEQIDKLSVSNISTIHSFCSKMLRKYFFLQQLNPNFLVLDETHSNYLKANALKKVLDKFSNTKNPDFVLLSQAFGGGRTFANLKTNILNFYEFLCSLKDKFGFLEKAKVCYEPNLNKNIACRILNEYLILNFVYFSKKLENFLLTSRQMKAEKFEKILESAVSQANLISFSKNFFENHRALFNIDLPHMPKGKLSAENLNFKLEFLPFWKSFLKQISNLKSLFISPDIENLSKDLIEAQKLVDVFIQVFLAFEKEYSFQKSRRNALDFNDLERGFVNLIENEEVACDIKNSYKFVFVDEYQDINDVQEFILLKISNGKNLIMVGDVKQSIYGFRNSSPQIFVNKNIKFEKDSSGFLVNMNENFRSNPQILEFVNAIFGVCMSKNFGGVDYKKDGNFVGMTKYEKSPIPAVKLCIIDNTKEEDDNETTFNFDGVYSVLSDRNNYKQKTSSAQREAMIVADNILGLEGKEYYDAKQKVFKKIRFGDIALICRTNDFLREVSNVLLEYNIPVSTNLKENIFADKDVLCLISLLRLVDNFHDDISLATVLPSIFGGFDFEELSLIRQKFFEEKFFYNACKRYKDEVGDELSLKLKKFFDLVLQLKERLTFESIYDLLWFLENKFDFLAFFNALPDGNNRKKVLCEFISSFDKAEYNFDLNKFLNYVDNFLKDNKVSSNLNSDSDCVKLQTIHACKGREFPIVFLVGCGKSFSNRFLTSEILKDRDLGLGLFAFDFENYKKSTTLARSAISLKIKKEENAEELRLLYVALTRAKNHLIITGETNLKNLLKVKESHQAEFQNNYLNWILSGLSDSMFEKVKKKESFKKEANDFELEVQLFDKDSFEYKTPKKVAFEFNETDEKLKKEIKIRFDFNPEISNIALKNTVSSMLEEYTDDLTNINLEPQKLTVEENLNFNIDSAKLGTFYHRIMQAIDFEEEDFETHFKDIILKLNIPKKYLDKIDKKKIVNCANYIKSLNPIEIKKEQPFLSYLPYNFIFKDSKITDKVLIQGVADLLLVMKNKTILIDYKITRVTNADQLVEKYGLQLYLYKVCLEKAINARIDEAYVYSFSLEKLIKIV